MRSVRRASLTVIAEFTLDATLPTKDTNGLRTSAPQRPSPTVLILPSVTVSSTLRQLSTIDSQTLPNCASAESTFGFTAPPVGCVIANVVPAVVEPITSILMSLPLAPFHLATMSTSVAVAVATTGMCKVALIAATIDVQRAATVAPAATVKAAESTLLIRTMYVASSVCVPLGAISPAAATPEPSSTSG